MLLWGRIPEHVAVIMDGNGRWAEMRGLPRIEGHKRGAERTREVIAAAMEVGVNTLSLYAFSLENWQRPDEEVSMLMKLLEFYLKKEFSALIKKGIVFRTISTTQAARCDGVTRSFVTGPAGDRGWTEPARLAPNSFASGT